MLGDRVASHLIRPTGWIAALAENAQRRLAAYGAPPGCPVVVSGYGAKRHDDQWVAMVEGIQQACPGYNSVPWEWAPSGHFLADYAEPLRGAIDRLRAAGHRRAAILPLYLGISSYQESLIPGVIAEYPDMEFHFQPDGILPDEGVAHWAAGQIQQAMADETTGIFSS